MHRKKGKWARRMGCGAAGVWVGGWLHLNPPSCHQPLRPTKRNTTEGGGGAPRQAPSLHREPQHNRAVLCAGKQGARGKGGGAFELSLACNGVWVLSKKCPRGPPRAPPPAPLPGSSSALLPLRCALDHRCWMGASRWRLSVEASWYRRLLGQGLLIVTASQRNRKASISGGAPMSRGSWPWQPLPGSPKRLDNFLSYFVGC